MVQVFLRRSSIPFAILAIIGIFGVVYPAGAQSVPAPSSSSTKAPWSWPSIPTCLKDAATATSGKDDYSSPACAAYTALLDSGAADIELDSALRLNAEVNGVLYPAFLPGTEVVRFIVTNPFNKTFGRTNRLVRVSTSPNGAQYGSWWTTLHQVQDAHRQLKDGDELRAELALTYTPSCIAYAKEIRMGVRGYMGVVAPAFDEPGGAIEFWFPPNAVVVDSVSPVPGGSGCPAP